MAFNWSPKRYGCVLEHGHELLIIRDHDHRDDPSIYDQAMIDKDFAKGWRL